MGAEELVRPSDIIRFIDGKMDNFTLPDEMNDFPGRVFSTRLWRFGDIEVNAVVQQENFHIFHIVGKELQMDIAVFAAGSFQNGSGDVRIEYGKFLHQSE